MTFNPHIHALVAKRIIVPSGIVRLLPPLPEAPLDGAGWIEELSKGSLR